MDENRKDINNSETQGYEPNFILKDTPEPAKDPAQAAAGRPGIGPNGPQAKDTQILDPYGAAGTDATHGAAGTGATHSAAGTGAAEKTGAAGTTGAASAGTAGTNTAARPQIHSTSGATHNAAGPDTAARPQAHSASGTPAGGSTAGQPKAASSSGISGMADAARRGAAAGLSGAAAGLSGAAAGLNNAADAAAARASQVRDSRADTGPVNGGRPIFENPSFTEGTTTGTYTDPRDSFRYGESASWNNGRSRKQKEYHKKPSKPITLTKRSLGILIACCMLISLLFGMGGSLLGNAMIQQHSNSSAQQAQATASSGSSSGSASSNGGSGYSLQSATGNDLTVKEITAMAKDSVVEIRTEGVVSDSWMQQYVTEGAGSGVIISEDGYIMTNNHVIENSNKITVKTTDGTEYEAKLIGADENNDVAVIKVEASGLTPATYGNSDQLEVGEMAVAIGNPLGELGGSVSAGIISATDRALAIDGKTLHLLQTDSSINPGNSGGGLFNGSGQLIGLVVAKSSGSDVEGLGFAIPINTAADVAAQLMDKGYVSGQPYTGMTYQEAPASSGNAFNFFGSGSTATQVTIYSVNGENAKKAGFQKGDIVLAVDDQEIDSFDTLSSIITSHKVGDEVTFTVSRDGAEKKIKMELEEKPQNTENGQSGSSDQDPSQDQEEGSDGNGEEGQDPFSQDQNGGNWESQDPFGGDNSGGGSFFDFFF